MSPFCGKIVREYTTETRSEIGSCSKDEGGSFGLSEGF